MSSSSSPALQGLDHLDWASPDFHDKLSEILHGKEYAQCVLSLQDDEVVWLVDYLDKVCRRVTVPHSSLKAA